MKKVLCITTVLMLLISVLGGCAGKGSEKEITGGTTAAAETSGVTATDTAPTEEALNKDATIRVWFGLYPTENEMLRQIGSEFTKDTGVKVEVIDNNFFEIRQKYPIAAAAADAPDLLLVQAADIGTLIAGDTLRPLEYVEGLAAGFEPVAVDAFRYGGKVYGIGYSGDAYGIVYNKKLISEVPKTWEEFFKKADELTTRDAKGNVTQYGFMIDPTNYWFTYPILEKNGGYHFGKNADGSYNMDDVGVAKEGTVKGVEELLALKGKGLTTMTTEEDNNIVSQRFSEGKVAMMIYALWNAQTYKDNNIDYGYAPLPGGSKPLGSVLGFVANKNSRNGREADAFLKRMMTDENQQRLFEAGNENDAKNGQRCTLNKAVYSSQYVQTDPTLKSLMDVSRSCQVFPSNPEATILWTNSKQAMDSIFYNGNPVADILNQWSESIKADIVKMRN